jgi:hypothetical protein
LRAEHRVSAGAGTIRFELSLFEHQAEKFQILRHGGKNLTTRNTKDTKRNAAVESGGGLPWLVLVLVLVLVLENCG